jgi:hypothetical protein
MVTVTLDKIIRNILLKRKYPIHYYLEFLLYTSEALRELSMDVNIGIINTKNLPVNAYNAVDLPNDFLDLISVNMTAGQKLRPLVADNSITPLNAFDSSFNITTYQNTAIQQSNALIYNNVFLTTALWNTTSFNQYGEPTGRFFGIGAGSPSETYRLIKERNQIQLNENLVATNIVLCYISNGLTADTASQISPYAERTIDSYAMWQFKENNRTYGAGEAEQARQIYISDRKVLTARVSDITIDGIRRIIQKNSKGSIKD